MERWYGGKPVLQHGALGAERWYGGTPVPGTVHTPPSLLLSGAGVVVGERGNTLPADALVTDDLCELPADAWIWAPPELLADALLRGQRRFPVVLRRFPRVPRVVPRIP